jgi:hypothetical protein
MEGGYKGVGKDGMRRWEGGWGWGMGMGTRGWEWRVGMRGRGRWVGVTVSPSPQSKDEENEKLHELRRYARDFRCQHTTDAERFNWDSDDEDYGLAIGRLVVT